MKKMKPKTTTKKKKRVKEASQKFPPPPPLLLPLHPPSLRSPMQQLHAVCGL